MNIAQIFADTSSGIEAALAKAVPGDLVARKTLALHSARLGERLFAGRQPLALCGVLAPFELLNAMDVTPTYAEFTVASLASAGDVAPLIDAAEQLGYPTDACTYHRAAFGLMRQGLMPEPDVLIATSAPCTGGVALVEEISRDFGKPLFLLHLPERDDAAAVQHVASQLVSLGSFLEEKLGRRLDQATLRTAIELANQARELLVEVYELAARVPTPARRRDLVNFAVVFQLFAGTETAVELARTYRNELRRKVELGMAGTPGERVRLLWIQNRLQFRAGIEEMLEEQFGAAVVADELNAVTWGAIDPQEPYAGLARRLLSSPFTTSIEGRVRHLQDMARDYQVHGAVNPCHWGCRQGTGARGLVTSGLREVGVPTLNLEVDCVDRRSFSEGQVWTRLQAFMEMIQDRDSPATA